MNYLSDPVLHATEMKAIVCAVREQWGESPGDLRDSGKKMVSVTLERKPGPRLWETQMPIKCHES